MFIFKFTYIFVDLMINVNYIIFKREFILTHIHTHDIIDMNRRFQFPSVFNEIFLKCKYLQKNEKRCKTYLGMKRDTF